MSSNNKNVQDFGKISKVGQQTQRQINFVDKLLNQAHSDSKPGGIRSINPNPILGTDREKELKINQLLEVENDIKKLAFQANVQGIRKGFSTILNQDMIQQLNEQSMDHLTQKKDERIITNATMTNERQNQANGMSAAVSPATQNMSPTADGKTVMHVQTSGFAQNSQHIMSGQGQLKNAIQFGSPAELKEKDRSFSNHEKTSSNQYLSVTPGQIQEFGPKDVPFMVNQKTSVDSKNILGLKSDKHLGKKSLGDIICEKDVNRQGEAMSGTLTNNEVLQVQVNAGGQNITDTSNQGGFGPFSKIKTNSLEEPDSKSSNDITSDHLPGIHPQSQFYISDSKGNLGFAVVSPNHQNIAQQIQMIQNKDLQTGKNSLQGLFGSAMVSNESRVARKTTSNHEVDQLLKQVRSRKVPHKLNALLYNNRDQLNSLNPIKVTKIYAKNQNTDQARNVYKNLMKESNPSVERVDNANSPTFPHDDFQDGLNNFSNLQKVTANMDPLNFNQWDQANQGGNNIFRAIGDKKHSHVTDNRSLLGPSSQYYTGNYLKSSNPLKINNTEGSHFDEGEKNALGPFIRGHTKKIYHRRKEYSQVQGRHFDDVTPKFHDSVDMDDKNATWDKFKTIPALTRRNQTRESELNELPKIKRVSIAPRLDILDGVQISTKRQGMTPLINNRPRATNPRWKTPINNTIENLQNSTQFSFNTSIEEANFGKRANADQIDKMNRTQDFQVFKQGFSASKFPRYYKPNENSPKSSSGKVSPRMASTRSNMPMDKNSLNFKFALDSKKDQKHQGKNSVSIGLSSRIKLIEQIQTFKTKGFDQKSSQNVSNTVGTAAATERDQGKFIKHIGAHHLQNTQEATTISEIAPTEAPITRTANTNQRHRLVQELQEMIGEANHKDGEQDLVELQDSIGGQNKHDYDYQESFEYLQQARTENISQQMNETLLTPYSAVNQGLNPQVNIATNRSNHMSVEQQIQLANAVALGAQSSQQSTNPKIIQHKQDKVFSAVAFNKLSPVTSRTKQSPRINSLPKSNQGSPARAKLSLTNTNFYRDIESNPGIPVLVDLQVQDQMRALQKKIRAKKEKIKEQFVANEKQRQVFQQKLQQRAQLLKALQKYERIDTNNTEMTEENLRRSIAAQGMTDLGAENITVSDQDRSTQLHATSTAYVEQLASFQKQIGIPVNSPLGNSRHLGSQDQRIDSKEPSGGIQTQAMQSLAQINDNSMIQSLNELQGSKQLIKEEPVKRISDQQVTSTLKANKNLTQMMNTASMQPTDEAFMLSSGQQILQPEPNYSQTPKFDQSRSVNKLAIKAMAEKNKKNLLIERQLLYLYKDTFTNDFKREKAQLDNQTDLVKSKVDIEIEEIKNLKQENALILKTIRRYMQFIDNFKQSRDNFQNYKVNKVKDKVKEQFKTNLMQRIGKYQTQKLQGLESGVADISIKEDLAEEILLDKASPKNVSDRLSPPGVFNNSKGSNLREAEGISMMQTETDGRNFESFSGAALAATGQKEQGFSFQKNLRQGISAQSSLATIPTQITQNAEKLDMGKVVKFAFQVQNACKNSEKPLDFALILLDSIKQFIGCSKAMIVPIDYFLGTLMTSRQYNARDKMSYVHNVEFTDNKSGDQKKLAAVARSDQEISSKLVLETISDKDEPDLVVSGNKMAILFRQGKYRGGPSFALQVEVEDQSEQQMGTEHSRSMLDGKRKNSRMNNNSKANQSNKSLDNFQKRASLEGLIIQVVFRSVQMKFETMQQVQKIKNFNSSNDTSLKMITQCTECQTLKGLMRTMYQTYQKYTGFDEMNILFHDPEKDALYAITFGDDEEHALDVKNALKRATTEQQREAILVKESVRDVTMSSNSMIYYPIHLGLTSKVFKDQKSYMMNNFKAAGNFDFVNEIDNPKGIKEVKNIMIGALRREDGSTNGIIQLYNSKNPITKFEQKKFEAVSKFFGGMIEKVEDKTKKLTTIVAVQIAKDDPLKALNDAYSSITEDGTIATYVNMLKPLDAMTNDLKRNFNIASPEYAHLNIPPSGDVK